MAKISTKTGSRTMNRTIGKGRIANNDVRFQTRYGDIKPEHTDTPSGASPKIINVTDCYSATFPNNDNDPIRGAYTVWLFYNEDDCEYQFEGVFHSTVPGLLDYVKTEDVQSNYSFSAILKSINNFIGDLIAETNEEAKQKLRE